MIYVIFALLRLLRLLGILNLSMDRHLSGIYSGAARFIKGESDMRGRADARTLLCTFSTLPCMEIRSDLSGFNVGNVLA